MTKRIISGDPEGQHLWMEAEMRGVRLGMQYLLTVGPEEEWANASMLALTWEEWTAINNEVVAACERLLALHDKGIDRLGDITQSPYSPVSGSGRAGTGAKAPEGLVPR